MTDQVSAGVPARRTRRQLRPVTVTPLSGQAAGNNLGDSARTAGTDPANTQWGGTVKRPRTRNIIIASAARHRLRCRRAARHTRHWRGQLTGPHQDRRGGRQRHSRMHRAAGGAPGRRQQLPEDPCPVRALTLARPPRRRHGLRRSGRPAANRTGRRIPDRLVLPAAIPCLRQARPETGQLSSSGVSGHPHVQRPHARSSNSRQTAVVMAGVAPTALAAGRGCRWRHQALRSGR
jgi:hypothetical protein